MSLTNTTDVTPFQDNQESPIYQDNNHNVAVTRSTGIEFIPPKTHDMVRSLFDPTIKKSFLEIIILGILLSNFVLAYWLYSTFGLVITRWIYLGQYIFWRLSYNVGIGYILHYQSHYESLTKFATKHHLFEKKARLTSTWANMLQFELQSKLDNQHQNDIYKYPNELNVWLIFRQFVDLILMQDFNTYMIFVLLSLPINDLSQLIQWKSILGSLLILFNIWVKLDAHRVVKDFAWYWGDFFFLQKNSELIFDGVFNISPHPMYSIGYAGYYGLSLISGDYHVLLVSIWGHLSQFLFLKYVETPHIERTYGDGNDEDLIISNGGNCGIDDLITRENYDYSRPLISIGIWLEHFDKLRIGDLTTVFSLSLLIIWYLTYQPSTTILFGLTFVMKLISWIMMSYILWNQHVSKWFTRLYLSHGYTQVYSYQQWQFIYNFSQSLCYTLLILQTLNQMKVLYIDDLVTPHPIKNDMNEILFGILLCSLQIWCNEEIRSAISDFGWFYGDFFLSNYITNKKLTSQGIYKYLNDPETILGVSGVWGTVLMTRFNWFNISLATLWTVTNFILIKFIERPHMIKLYGNDDTNRQSGIQRTLLQLKPIRRVSELVDNVEHIIVRNFLQNNRSMENAHNSDDNAITSDQDSNLPSKRKDWDEVLEHAIYNVGKKTLKDNCELIMTNIKGSLILPHEITLHWKIPKSIYTKKDWIGLYKVMDTQTNHKYTRISSNDHWQYVNKNSHDIFISHNDKLDENNVGFIEGDIIFDYHLLYFEQGIFEFRYHSNNSHQVVTISSPFEIKWPELERTTLQTFIKSLRNLIRDNIGITLNEEYIKNVQGNLNTICNKSWEIKKILDDLE